MQKLVRDKIVEMILSKGENVNFYIADDEEYLSSLLTKLVEEANEVEQSSDNQELKEEIADVLEVIEAICKAKDLEINEIQRIKQEKKDKRGGFEKRIILKS